MSTPPHLVHASESIPWPEHPRPDLLREAWVNLNGEWLFEFDPDNAGVKQGWFAPGRHAFTRRVTVPFPWESELSGLENPEKATIGWYMRSITIPDDEGWRGREPWLIIGASDFHTTVWVDGHQVAEREGGYTPIEVRLAPHAQPGQTVRVIVRVEDRTDPQQPTGKQIHWYTTTSGIWQTVYLEARPGRYLRSYRSEANIDRGTLRVIARIAGKGPAGKLRLRSPEDAFATVMAVDPGHQADQPYREVEATLRVTRPRLWSPESPRLYDLVLELVDAEGDVADRVQSYFGLREISIGPAPGRDYQYVYLNGKPVYLRGALHQAFHPAGIYQYPDDATLRGDYALARELDLNFIRIHIKAPIPRALYWADRLGVLIMQDMPNFWRASEQAFTWYEQMLERVIERDANHPSIFSWCNFNETWGFTDGGYSPEDQAFVKRMVHKTRRLDPTRLVEDNSPCRYDHIETDINSWHFYINDYQRARDHIREVVEKTYPGSRFNYVNGYVQGNEPLINSEYGGISSGMGDQDISWCFKYLTNELRLHGKIGGYVYTELSDIEWEHNGFVNYDRSPKEFGYDFWFPGMTVADLNGADFVVIDAPPCVEFKPDQHPVIPIRVSHYSGRWTSTPILRWRVDWFDALGRRKEGTWRTRPAQVEPYTVTDQPSLTITPDEEGLVGALLVELRDQRDVLARNYINLLVDRPTATGWRVVDDRQLAVSFPPEATTAWTFGQRQERRVGLRVEKLASTGAGQVDYILDVPEEIPLDDVKELTLLAEMAARAGDEKRDWSTRPGKQDLPHYPQTDEKKTPTEVALLIDGIKVGTQTLPDDPADGRGAMSHHRGHQGTYGYLTTFVLDGPVLEQALARVKNERRLKLSLVVPDRPGQHGLAIFGAGLGRYPVDPTIVLAYEDPGHGLGDTLTRE